MQRATRDLCCARGSGLLLAAVAKGGMSLAVLLLGGVVQALAAPPTAEAAAAAERPALAEAVAGESGAAAASVAPGAVANSAAPQGPVAADASAPAQADAAQADAAQAYGRHQFDEAERNHWAFLPVVRPPLPEVQRTEWVQSPVDAFVLADLERHGLQPAPPADARTLLRRVYLDLIGLPPTPTEVEAFLENSSREALSLVVEELLSRPEYGERWARHWLDVVRYAESNGYERDGAKPNAWRYRDYVIQAFQQDKPYDRFVIEQLAGDELADTNAETQIATTFLRLGVWDDEPADPEVDRFDQLDDVLGVTASTFLAQTIRCARCHDHKFESFTQQDYYRLLAVFAPLKRPQDGRTDLDRFVGTPAELAAYQQQADELAARTAAARTALDQQEWSICRRLAEAGLLTATPGDDGLPDEALAALTAEPGQRSEAQRELAAKYRGRAKAIIEQHASAEERAALDRLQRELEDLRALRPPEPPRAYVWYEEGTPPATHLLARGDPKQPLAEVQPGLPAILVDRPPPPPEPTARTSGRRLALARWLVQPDHPLTARVMVNRIWQHHFGDGLVGSENDFGVMGELPTHPQLLDWLASEFVACGWSIKHMHRLMVLSSTYQMASCASEEVLQADPNNNRLTRFEARRLEAEAVRDCILYASGSLNRARGGPSVFPKISPAVLAGQSRPGNGWTVSDPHQAARRSIYVFVKRTLLVPELEVLDFPDTNNACEQRLVSTVATQALTYLNGEFVQKQASAFAARLMQELPGGPERDAARIERAFQLTLCRPPTAAELEAVLDFLQRQRAFFGGANSAPPPSTGNARASAVSADAADAATAAALRGLCLVLFNTNEFVYLH
ncbi:MAG: DUF1553 domain-containing protein [Pirellulales bacterium]|nr:DUF1553 domain-containing protein [Pirellulales bacterium]